jgi:hypothetical protein
MVYYSEIITKQILNEQTGEIEKVSFTKDAQITNNGKGGWRKMYTNGYDEAMFQLKSTLEMKLFVDVRDRFTATKSRVAINQAKLARQYNSTPATINKFFKKMIQVGFLTKDDEGAYLMNPFIFIPYQADAKKLQDEWTALVRVEA